MNLEANVFPELLTERLLLRELIIDDAPEIHQLRSDPEMNKYLGRKPSTGLADAEAYIQMITELLTKHESRYWALSLKGETKLIGTVCLWNFNLVEETIEIGYELSPDYQGKGLMTEAVAAAIEYGFTQMEAKIITAFFADGNEKSVSLLQRLNFKPADEQYFNRQEDVASMLIYVLKREDFKPNPA